MQVTTISRRLLGIVGRAFFMPVLVGLLMGGGIAPVEAAPPAQSPEEGKAIFQQKCASCHTVGGGQLVGPDLQGVTALRDRDWLIRWISDPNKMLAEGDPIATQMLQEYNNIPMPNMGLSETDVLAVLAYLGSQSGEAAPAPAPAGEATPAQAGASTTPQPVQVPTPAAGLGNPQSGRMLVIGERELTNGGPACISCHSVDQVGALGGGTLGPDLTNVYSRYGGEAGLAAALNGLPFPTMQGVFAGKPLTAQEQADLLAFFAEADQATAAPPNYNFVWIGLGGFVVLGLVGQFAWRKRLTGVRKSLLGGTK
jgi:mono/diheme cytochrome c family protein